MSDKLKYYKRYCKDIESVENYEKAKADNFNNWVCHHRRETHLTNGERRDTNISVKELKALGLYYNRPVDELIFLARPEHTSLHHKGKRGEWIVRHHSVETKKKLSKARKSKTFTKECLSQREAVIGTIMVK